MLDIYERIYFKLNKLTNGLEAFMTNEEPLTLESKGFVNVLVEKISSDEIILSHYSVIEGKICKAPEILIKICPYTKKAEAIRFRSDYKTMEENEVSTNLKRKRALNGFLNYWLSALKEQGFYK